VPVEGNIFGEIGAAFAAGRPIVIGTPTNVDNDKELVKAAKDVGWSLIGHHAYAIVGVDSVNKTVKLFNPHSQTDGDKGRRSFPFSLVFKALVSGSSIDGTVTVGTWSDDIQYAAARSNRAIEKPWSPVAQFEPVSIRPDRPVTFNVSNMVPDMGRSIDPGARNGSDLYVVPVTARGPNGAVLDWSKEAVVSPAPLVPGPASFDLSQTSPEPGKEYIVGTLHDLSEYRPLSNYRFFTLSCPPDEPWDSSSKRCGSAPPPPPPPPPLCNAALSACDGGCIPVGATMCHFDKYYAVREEERWNFPHPGMSSYRLGLARYRGGGTIGVTGDTCIDRRITRSQVGCSHDIYDNVYLYPAVGGACVPGTPQELFMKSQNANGRVEYVDYSTLGDSLKERECRQTFGPHPEERGSGTYSAWLVPFGSPEAAIPAVFYYF